jgi:hypothetical protein
VPGRLRRRADPEPGHAPRKRMRWTHHDRYPTPYHSASCRRHSLAWTIFTSYGLSTSRGRKAVWGA